MFTWSYYDNRNAIAAQAGQFEALQAPLTAAAASPASVEQPAIDSALYAMAEVANARTPPPSSAQDLLGPSASAELLRAQADTYDHALRNVLEPHMVALLEATMWRQLLADPAVAGLKEWIPANFAGPNGAKVFARRSDKTLRVGISGAFTYSGFHDAILDRIEDVAAQAALDRAVFA
ncbi:MAG: type VI secretion system membrane subunit TssM, partial [Mesorhizobium sp.]